MGKIIELSKFKQDRKTAFLKSHEMRLEQFFEGFLNRHFQESFHIISEQYLAFRVNANEMDWDYHDFRDALKDAIAIVYGEQIWLEANATRWFNPKLISKDEVIDRCTSYFILRETRAANL